jgi:tetratricopeptide (TPR) repeat protein
MVKDGGARIYEESLCIPTYHIREDPNPPLFSSGDAWVYPYPRQDEIVRPRDELMTYRAVVLENQYLKVTVLPEIGGHLYSAFDKTLRREIFHKVPVIKPALIGLRGAWIPGGIEFNFIKGHHVMTVSPVDFLTRQNADGSVAVTVGHVERASRARWNVTLTLHPGRAYIQADLKLYNRHAYRLDFYQWSNSSMEARADLFLPYPTEFMLSGRGTVRYPFHAGADISRWASTPTARDFFAIGSDRSFMGAYYEQADVGMVHYAPYHHEVPGKKFFTWGTDDAGRIWDYILADGEVPYMEPQAGCVVDQSTFLFLPPHQVVSWREYWWGVRGMKGFVEVNDCAALNLAPVGLEATLMAANSTRAYQGAHLRLLINGSLVHEAILDIAPEQPYYQEVALPHAAWRYADVQLVFSAADGQAIVTYHQPAPDPAASATLPQRFNPQVDARSSVEELAVAANEAEKLRDYARAEQLYRQALVLDPGYARALAGLGALHCRQGLYARACEELTAALRRDPDLGAGHYHLALACRALGNLKEANDHFWAVRLDPGYSSQAFYYLGEIALSRGNHEEAAAFLRRSLDRNRLHVKGQAMLALCLRKLGHTEDARAILGTILQELEPADVLAQAELWQLQPSAEHALTLQARIGGDVQVLLELASDYAGVGLWPEASAVLGTWPTASPEQPAQAMLHYTLAYCQDKLGQQELAQETYRRAAQMNPAYVFPHRLEELDILRRALEANPHDARARLSLGNLLYALRREEEATACWRESLLDEENIVARRNLGKALWKNKGDLSGARAEYERAIATSPADFRLHSDLYDLLAEMGCPAVERLALLASAPQHGRIQARRVAVLVELARWDEAIQALQEMQFDPYEGEESTRPAYYAAYLARALQRYEQHDLPGSLSDLQAALCYPRNVGVGRSYYAQDTKALYWAGVVTTEMGDAEKARRYWEQGADARPWPWQGVPSVRAGYQADAGYYKSLCLQKLGRYAEAAELF